MDKVKPEVKRVYVDADAAALKAKGTSSAARQSARLALRIIKRARVPNKETHDEMRKEGLLRKIGLQALKNYSKNPAHYSTSSEQAAKTWADFVKSNGAAHTYGMDALGLANRDKSKKIGFSLTKTSGRFNPFIVANGILRGGQTGHMEEEGNGRASIPTELSDKRKLVSCRGKYTDPSMFPASRIVKFMRGNWGIARKINQFERI